MRGWCNPRCTFELVNPLFKNNQTLWHGEKGMDSLPNYEGKIVLGRARGQVYAIQ